MALNSAPLLRPNILPFKEYDIQMFKSLLRHLGRHNVEKASCPLSFGSRSLRRMRWQSLMLFRR